MTAKNQILTFLAVLMFYGCANSQTHSEMNKDSTHKFTNELINESSPYLLQHAHNPVNWVAWNQKAFERAQQEDKLVLVSIGYSSCHWCHVMEHESFEDEGVAELMNEKFICIKVDREERPDVDQVYMTAVQLMTGQGGWPLNCITLPDGRPIFGGTYFSKNKWVEVLKAIDDTYRNNKEKALEYADNLTQGVQNQDLISIKAEEKSFTADRLNEMMVNWSKNFDNFRGGSNRAPKFPLPNNYEFLSHYAYVYRDSSVMEHVDLTLKRLAYGGIYDQIGGGFARYSTDTEWKVPHFEKMLYDNAQLVSLYSHAFQRKKDPLYKHIVYQTLEWVQREMTTEEGSFYSALDADSEGEEGKFYVWSKDELKSICGEDYELAQTYYNISSKGLWEGKYILLRHEDDPAIADQFEMDVVELGRRIDGINKRLLTARDKRIRPGLDDKSLTSWNAMMAIGYLDAYQAFGEEKFLSAALKNVSWLEQYQIKKNGSLFHTYKNNESTIHGFLDDYAFVIALYVKLYEVTFQESYLTRAKEITLYTKDNFLDVQSGMFFYSQNEEGLLVARQMEINDNVIPASNSMMALNLWRIGTLTEDVQYLEMSIQMAANVYGEIHKYGSGYSNWGILLLHMIEPYYEVAITGPEWKTKLKELNQYYRPNKILMGGTEGNLPLLQGKFSDKTTYFVCVNKSCKLPVNSADEAAAQMK